MISNKFNFMMFFVILIFSNCNYQSDSTVCDTLNGNSLKYGIIYNGCGPTDAPVVRIILTDEEFSCGDSHRNVKHISSYLEITNVEDIKVGMVISGHSYNYNNEPESAIECEKDFENCVEVGVISLEILCDDGKRLEGIWRLIDSNRSGNFYVKKCDQQRGLCG